MKNKSLIKKISLISAGVIAACSPLIANELMTSVDNNSLFTSSSSADLQIASPTDTTVSATAHSSHSSHSSHRSHSSHYSSSK